MTHSQSNFMRSALTLALLAALAACGGGGTTVVDTTTPGGGGTTPSTTQRWTAVATVASAPTTPTAVLPTAPLVTVSTNDPFFTNAPALTTASSTSQTANINGAWTLSTGTTHNIVVAVLDTGVDATHPDLVGRVLQGYNFRADPVRNTDTSPHGPTSCSNGANWSPGHGTAVAGTIAANSNNSVGVTGVHWGAKVLPVRVNDGCMSSIGDIADAIRWAAGLTVSGAPTNTTPAKVINVSQGAAGACLSTLQAAVDAAIAAGSIVIASAGNSSGAVGMPANCAGVIAVANSGVTAYGPEVAVTTLSGIYSTYLNATYGNFGGTSSATAATSGVVALVLSEAPSLNAIAMRNVLMESARPFVSFPQSTGVLGAGYLDAWRALNYVQSMLMAQISTSAVASNGSAMTLSNASVVSGAGASITSYSWSQVSGAATTLTGASSAVAGVVFPAGAGTYVFKLIVTDSLGRSSSALQTVVVGA